MRIICVDRSRFGLSKLKRLTKQIVPEAQVVGVRKPADAVVLANSLKVDVLLTEIDFGGSRWEGLELARKVKSIHPAVNIIFVTAESGSDLGDELISLRCSGLVTKPYEAGDLRKEFENLRYPPASRVDEEAMSAGKGGDGRSH